MTEVAFDDKKSLLHFLTGIATARLGPAGILIIIIFVIYQKREREPYLNKLGDFIEFILGILAGLLF